MIATLRPQYAPATPPPTRHTARYGVAGRASLALALACALVGMLASFPGRASNAGADADAEAIRAIGRSWMAYYQAGNYAAIPELYTEDAVIMARGRPRMEGRAALRGSIGNLAAGRKVDIEITERELEVRGDVAWFISDFKVTYTAADPQMPPKVEYGRSMLIYLRGADGKWRIHRDMDSPAPQPP